MVVNADDMNLHCIKLNLYQLLSCLQQNTGQYAAKRTAFWCKTQAILVQNASRFGAKRKAFWC